MPFIEKKRLTHEEKYYNREIEHIEREFPRLHPVRTLCELVKNVYREVKFSNESQQHRFSYLFERMCRVTTNLGLGLGPKPTDWHEQEDVFGDNHLDFVLCQLENARKRASLAYIHSLQDIALGMARTFREENSTKRVKHAVHHKENVDAPGEAVQPGV